MAMVCHDVETSRQRALGLGFGSGAEKAVFIMGCPFFLPLLQAALLHESPRIG
jgi:hypothetical protein